MNPGTTEGWARLLVGSLDTDVLDDLAVDPIYAAQAHFGLELRRATGFATRGNDGWCDGVSFLDEDVILYRPTLHRGENFTVAHELGHFLAESEDDCIDWLADRDEPGRDLERLCDEIAGRVLVRDGDLDKAFDGPVSADGLVRLFETTSASRTACMIAARRRLPCEGFIVLMEDGSNRIFHTTKVGDTRPAPWKGASVPAGHPLRSTTPPPRCRTYWPYPTTSRDGQREYFMSTAVEPGGWRFAVFAVNNLWDVPGLHFADEEPSGSRYDGQVNCQGCGYSGTTAWWPCKDCGEPSCPRCHECGCDRRRRLLKEQRCSVCTKMVAAHLLEDGVCDGCR